MLAKVLCIVLLLVIGCSALHTIDNVAFSGIDLFLQTEPPLNTPENREYTAGMSTK